MDLTESTDDFEVFNQPSPPKKVPEEIGIQRKPQRSLQELLESQPGRGEARNLLSPSFHLLHPGLLLAFLNHPYHPEPNRLILRGGGNRRVKK